MSTCSMKTWVNAHSCLQCMAWVPGVYRKAALVSALVQLSVPSCSALTTARLCAGHGAGAWCIYCRSFSPCPHHHYFILLWPQRVLSASPDTRLQFAQALSLQLGLAPGGVHDLCVWHHWHPTSQWRASPGFSLSALCILPLSRRLICYWFITFACCIIVLHAATAWFPRWNTCLALCIVLIWTICRLLWHCNHYARDLHQIWKFLLHCNQVIRCWRLQWLQVCLCSLDLPILWTSAQTVQTCRRRIFSWLLLNYPALFLSLPRMHIAWRVNQRLLKPVTHYCQNTGSYHTEMSAS